MPRVRHEELLRHVQRLPSAAMTDVTTTLAFVAAFAITVVAIGAVCYRSETARAISDRYDDWDWRD